MNKIDKYISKERGKYLKDENKKISQTKEAFINLINKTMDKEINLYEIYPEIDNLEKTLEQIQDLKKSLDSFRPLEGIHIEKINRYFDELYTYDSTTIEGNTLTFGETSLVLNKGITISGKSLREHFEVINHIESIEYIKNNEDLNHKVLLELHYLILKSIDNHNAGKYRNVNVRISGAFHLPPNYLKVPKLMDEYFDFYEKNKNKINPVVLSANMHEKLVTIHPFIDGNGRIARLIMNLILLKNGYPITNISSKRNKREEYYNTLEAAQTQNDDKAFIKFIAKNVKKSLIEYLQVIALNDEKNLKGDYFYKRYLDLKS
ncbi:MAG: cell filamentation protein Fic [Deltaproteobacteria bacterium]|nr:MAG: cell filamentation protein Fic [Deltaproteobacteria bacterium]